MGDVFVDATSFDGTGDALLLLLPLLLECTFEVREGGLPLGMRKGEACVGDIVGGGAGVRGL